MLLSCGILQQPGARSLTPGGRGLPPEPLLLCTQPSGLTGLLSPQKGDSLHHAVEAWHAEHKELRGREGEGQHKVKEFSWSGSKNLLEFHIPSFIYTVSPPLHNQWVIDQSSTHTWGLSFWSTPSY